MSGLDALVAFLRTQIDNDERIATQGGVLAGDEWHVMEPLPGRVTAEVLRVGGTVAKAEWSDAEHMARWDPKRARAEVDAKRLLVDWAAMCAADEELGYMLEVTTPVMRILALPYADHPDYCEEWRP